MEEPSRTCRVCGQSFNSEDELQDHRRTIHESDTSPIENEDLPDIEGEDEEQVA